MSYHEEIFVYICTKSKFVALFLKCMLVSLRGGDKPCDSKVVLMSTKVKIDATDQRILKAFSECGYVSNTQLSEIVHLSQSACHQRVRALKRAGVLTAFQPKIDYKQLFKHIRVLTTVTLEVQNRLAFQKFEQAVKSIPNFTSCYHISGQYDYALIAVARDFDAYQCILSELVNQDLSVRNYASHIIHDHIKDEIVPASVFSG